MSLASCLRLFWIGLATLVGAGIGALMFQEIFFYFERNKSPYQWNLERDSNRLESLFLGVVLGGVACGTAAMDIFQQRKFSFMRTLAIGIGVTISLFFSLPVVPLLEPVISELIFGATSRNELAMQIVSLVSFVASLLTVIAANIWCILRVTEYANTPINGDP